MKISRRSSFTKVGSRVLPILAMIGGIALTVNAAIPVTGCKNGCKGTCRGMCFDGCTRACGASCFGKCAGSCIDSCRRSAKNTTDSTTVVIDTLINKKDSIR